MEEHHDEKQKGHEPVKFSSPACSFPVTNQAGYEKNNKNSCCQQAGGSLNVFSEI